MNDVILPDGSTLKEVVTVEGKDSDKGKEMTDKLRDLQGNLGMYINASFELRMMVENTHNKLKDAMGKKFEAYVKDGVYEPGDDKVDPLVKEFNWNATRMIEVEMDARNVKKEMDETSRKRNKWVQRMYRKYKLDKNFSYHFDWEKKTATKQRPAQANPTVKKQ